MARTTVALALAARAHGRDGTPLSAPETIEAIRSAASSFTGTGGGALAGPTSVVDGATIVVPLPRPEAVLPTARAIAASVRPARTTFCVARSELGSTDDSVESAILVAERAASEAAARIDETDFREARVLVAAPHPGTLVGALLGLILETYDGMTDRQRQIVELVRGSETQQEVANHLGVSRQAVNQSLIAAGWPHVDRAEALVERELATLWRGSRRHDDGGEG